MKRFETRAPGDFGHACDELFDELLGRWRRSAERAAAAAIAVDRGAEYQVEIEAAVADPREIEVEVVASTLVVRVPAGARPRAEHTITFAQPIDHEGTTASWSGGVLTVTLPKRRGRLVKVL